jgi:hypothetical protein
MEEFTCLSELGKYSKDKDAGFSERVAQFFWDLIVSKDTKKRVIDEEDLTDIHAAASHVELVDSCIQKYRDMVRYWDLEKKESMLIRLQECVRDPATPSLPCLKLLKGLVQDQSERTVYSPQTTSTQASTSGGGYSAAAQPQGSSAYGGGATGGSALRTRLPDSSPSPQDQPQRSPGEADEGEGEPVIQRELTLQSILASLLGEQGLVGHLLAAY